MYVQCKHILQTECTWSLFELCSLGTNHNVAKTNLFPHPGNPQSYSLFPENETKPPQMVSLTAYYIN